MLVAILAILVALALGLAVKTISGALANDRRSSVSVAELVVVAALMSLVFTPAIFLVGTKLSVDEVVRYEQFVNGVETEAVDDVTKCYEGHSGSSSSAGRSNCQHTWRSGTYSWQERHTRSVCSTTGSGKDAKTTCHDEVYYTTETAYIYTPYVTHEHEYSLRASMGRGGEPGPFTFNGAYADANPQPFRGNVAIPASVPRGAPADWLDAKAHLDAGDPRPVTMLSSYDNYILASGDELLKTYGPQIDSYKARGLLPDPVRNILTDPISGPSYSQADKVSFAGINPPNAAELQQAVMRFNAAFGMKLQGDLRLVIVDALQVPPGEAEAYTSSLKAYWQSDAYGKRALAKNTVIVILGIQDGKVDWARGTTGMPFGNEGMLQWVQDWLPGKSLNPATLMGAPITVIKPGITSDAFTDADYSVTLSTPRGALEEIMFEKAPFKRARMSCSDGTCVGYKDLLSKIEPTTTQKTWMVIVTGIVSLFCWIFVARTSVVDDLISRAGSRYRSSGPIQDSPYYSSVTDRRRTHKTGRFRL